VSPPSELVQFIRATLARGATDRFVFDLLKANGWPERTLYAAFSTYTSEETGIPVPLRAGPGESARDTFFYLLSFSTLTVWAIALGSLFFGLIEFAFPDPVASGVYASGYRRLQVATEVASLLVGFPVYWFVTRFINRAVEAEPARRQSPVRKWLTYLALFVASAILIGDCVAIVAALLRGELTVRFILKALTVFLTGGGIFAYYLEDIRSEVVLTRARRRFYALVAATAVGAAVVLGFTLTGSPSAQRALQADLQRVRQLQEIASSLGPGRGSGQLPESLPAELQRLDPVTGTPYEYTRLSGEQYQLCATFSTDTRGQGSEYSRFWEHPAGRHCFTLHRGVMPPPPR
jgi:hypothetical protein